MLESKWKSLGIGIAVSALCMCMPSIYASGVDFLKVSDNNNKTVFHYIADKDFEGAKSLLESIEEDVTPSDTEKFSNLLLAVKSKNLDNIISWLTDNLTLNEVLEVNNIKDNQFLSPLEMAVESNNIDILRFLVNTGVDINTKGKFGDTPLHIAVENSNFRMVNFILDMRANIYADNSFGEIPLYIAVKNNNNAMVNLIKRRSPKSYWHEADLTYAVQTNGTAFAKFLLKKGVSPKVVDNNLRNMLHIAVQNNNEELVQCFIDRGVSAKAKDIFGKTPLDYAKVNGNPNIIHMLNPVK